MKRTDGIPKFLYHYTGVKSAKLILMNKTLRFTSLKYMDDTTEALTGEGTDLGKFIFASSWTELADNIPQWSMYGNSSQGVCIKMESFPFKNNVQEYLQYIENPEDVDTGNPSELYITPVKYFYNNDFILNPTFIDDNLNLLRRRLTAKYNTQIKKKIYFPKLSIKIKMG